MLKPPHVLAIVGPTASGKSELALQIVERLPAEIISADSMQVYKGMDIATSKVSKAVRCHVKHHLVDVVSIKEPFNAFEYQKAARAAIEEIFNKEKTPIIVGGTGLYIRAALYDLNFAQEKTDLFKAKSIYSLITVGLTMSRDILYERINKRVDAMMAAGLLEETKKLIESGFKEVLTAKQALGYKELIEYLDGHISMDEAVETLKKRTRNYAKRQYTWFKKDPNVKWFDITQIPIPEIADQVIELLN